MVKQAREKGRPIVIAGMLLDVSFRDGIKEETAKAYGENLIRWIESTRKDIGNANLPIVMNRAIPPVARHALSGIGSQGPGLRQAAEFSRVQLR